MHPPWHKQGKHSVLTHRIQGGVGALWQREVQHKGRQHNAGHLFKEEHHLQAVPYGQHRQTNGQTDR